MIGTKICLTVGSVCYLEGVYYEDQAQTKCLIQQPEVL